MTSLRSMQNGERVTSCEGRSLGLASLSSAPITNLPPSTIAISAGQVLEDGVLAAAAGGIDPDLTAFDQTPATDPARDVNACDHRLRSSGNAARSPKPSAPPATSESAVVAASERSRAARPLLGLAFGRFGSERFDRCSGGRSASHTARQNSSAVENNRPASRPALWPEPSRARHRPARPACAESVDDGDDRRHSKLNEVLTFERRPAREKLRENQSQRINVGPWPRRPKRATELLGRTVPGRERAHSALGLLELPPLDVPHHLGDPEVEQLDERLFAAERAADPDVVGLDVAVGDSTPVHHAQHLGEGLDDLLGFFERPTLGTEIARWS